MTTTAIETLLAPWDGPCGGLPPFDAADPAAIEAAYRAAIDITRGEIAAIASNPAPPDFENSVAALEDAGRALARVETVFGVFVTTRNDDAMRAVQQRLAPLRPALDDAIAHDDALFARIEAVRADPGLTPEQRRLVELTHRRLVRRGAGLPQDRRHRLQAINGRLAALQAAFMQNVLADQERDIVLVEDVAELDGLDAVTIAAASAAAERHGHPGRWAIVNDRSAVTPVFTAARSRSLRERVWRMWIARAAASNPPVIAEMLALRGEKARLLGHANFAAFQLDDRMARTPDAAMALMRRVWDGALPRARAQSDALAPLAAADGINGPLAPWDRAYYAEALRRDRFGFDEAALKPYLSFDRMLEASFWVAGKLYDLGFELVSDVPAAHPDVHVYAVSRGGQPLGMLWVDPYARAGKLAGAWMDPWRGAEHFRGDVPPLVSVNLNLPAPAPGEPALMSWDMAHVLFHEMGHALHLLLTDVTYPSFGMSGVAWDMIELPSQIFERWVEDPTVLDRFARHHGTGDPMPASLVAEVAAARNFGAASIMIEVMGSAIVDMALQLAADGGAVDAAAVRDATLAELGMPGDLAMRHDIGHFTHIFSGDAYAAGYYCYIWADAMVADAAEAFIAAPGGLFDRPTADRFREAILGIGGAVPADEAYRAFRGREPDPEALMRRLGFVDA